MVWTLAVVFLLAYCVTMSTRYACIVLLSTAMNGLLSCWCLLNVFLAFLFSLFVVFCSLFSIRDQTMRYSNAAANTCNKWFCVTESLLVTHLGCSYFISAKHWPLTKELLELSYVSVDPPGPSILYTINVHVTIACIYNDKGDCKIEQRFAS